MFGYVRPFKPEMKVRDLELYRAAYCGLCHTLGGEYSPLMRLSLSYDLTFLALLLSGLRPGRCEFDRRRCPVHPLRRRPVCRRTEEFRLAADVGVILVYYKLRDGMRDRAAGDRARSLALMPAAAPAHRRARNRRADVERLAVRYTADQAQAEKTGAGLDAAAEPTAAMLAGLLAGAAADKTQSRILERFGYFLGKWVYLADAADDLDDDWKCGDFNPLLPVRESAAAPAPDFAVLRRRAAELMNVCNHEMAAAFELLHFYRFRPIIGNILYLGLPDMTEKIRSREKIRPV